MFFWKLLFFAVLFLGLFLAWIAFAKGTVPVLIFGVLPCGLITGILFIKVYLPKIAESVGFSLMFPRRFLKEKPLILSPYQRMLNTGKYEEAWSELHPLTEEHPSDPAVILLFATACMNLEGYAGHGFEAMERLFSIPERPKSVFHAKLLFYYADKAAEYQYTEQLIPILEQELLRKFYTESEKKSIRIRLESLKRRLYENR